MPDTRTPIRGSYSFTRRHAAAFRRIFLFSISASSGCGSAALSLLCASYFSRYSRIQSIRSLANCSIRCLPTWVRCRDQYPAILFSNTEVHVFHSSFGYCDWDFFYLNFVGLFLHFSYSPCFAYGNLCSTTSRLTVPLYLTMPFSISPTACLCQRIGKHQSCDFANDACERWLFPRNRTCIFFHPCYNKINFINHLENRAG